MLTPFGRRSARVAVVLAVISTAAGSWAQAQTRPLVNPTNRDIELSVPLFDGGRLVGQVSTTLGADQSVSVEGAAVRALLQDAVDLDALDRLLSLQDAQGLLTIEDFAESGMALSYDPSTLRLTFSAPARLRERREIGLARPRQQLANFAEEAEVSGYVNLRFGAEFDAGADAPLDGSILDVETVARFNTALFKRIGSPVIESVYSFEAEEGGASGRERSSVVLDFPGAAMRARLGDVTTRTTGFQDSIDILGGSLRRSFATLRPLDNVRASASRTFTLERAATVDLIVNGVTVRRLNLDPGTFDLRDIPLSAGANDIVLVVEDAAGNRETIEFQQFFRPDLLAPGVLEFELAGGVFAEASGLGRTYDFNREVVSLQARYGLMTEVTLGVNAQADEGAQLLGGEIAAATPLGDVTLEGAASRFDRTDDEIYGGAARVTFATRVPSVDFSFSEEGAPIYGALAVFADMRTEEFVTLDDEGPNEPLFLSTGLRYSQPLGASVNMSVGALRELGLGDESNNSIFSLGLGGAFLGNFTWSAAGEFQTDPGDSEERFSALFRLSRSFGPNYRASTSFNTDQSRTTVGADYQSSRTGVGALFAGVELAHDIENDIDVEGRVGYVGNRFQAIFSQESRLGDFGDSETREDVTRLQFGTALAFANDRFSVGRPITDGFLFAEPHPTLKDSEVLLRPSDDDYAASGRLGVPAVLGGLSPYRPQRVQFDVTDLPLGYDLGAGLFEVLPGYKAGYNLTVGSGGQATIVGRLVNVLGEPLGLATGMAAHETDHDLEPQQVFTNRKGRLALLSARPGRYRLSLDTNPPAVAFIEVSEDAVGLLQVGDIVARVDRGR